MCIEKIKNENLQLQIYADDCKYILHEITGMWGSGCPNLRGDSGCRDCRNNKGDDCPFPGILDVFNRMIEVKGTKPHRCVE